MSPKFIALWLFVGLARTVPKPMPARPGLPTNSSATMKTTAFSPIRRKESICGTGIKYIPLDGAGFLSFGGEARERFETYQNEYFSTNPNADNAYFFSVIFSTSITIRRDGCAFSRNCRVRSKWPAGGHRQATRPPDRDAIDTHQLFVDLVGNIRKDGQLTLRVGRQEMSYGAERLIAAREGPNNRRAFDEVRFLYKQGAVSVDAFFGNLVEIDRTGAFDDWTVPGVRFWGVYATMPFHPLPGIRSDIYYLGLINPQVVFNQGSGREECHTIGHAILWHSGPLGP